MLRFCALSGLLAAALFLAASATGGDRQDAEAWQQFRGPSGQGLVTGKMPTSWSDTQNKVWEAAIPGKGWSSPVIADGKVWLTTAVPAAGGGHTLRAVAFDQQSGKIRHDIELFTVAKPVVLHARNSHATPTAVLGKGRLYCHFGRDGAACIDTATGAVVWRNQELNVDYETGPATSPILYKDRLIIPCDGTDYQYVVALNAATGKILWKTERPEAAKKSPSERRAFATPLVFNFNGQDQIVIPGGQCVYCYEPATGVELWRVTYKGFSNVPSPVFAHGLVYVTTGFAAHELLAIRPDGKGDVTKSHVVWRFKKNVPNTSSPVVVGDHLFMVADKGIATCLDAKTGAVKWTERLPGAFTAALLANGNTIYAFGDEGKTVLFEASATFKMLGTNELPGRLQATPAVAGGSVFIRMERLLYRIGR